MKLRYRIARGVWRIRRRLHLIPPLAIVRELRSRGIDLRSRSALEMFGGDGTMHTHDYMPHLKSLEVWELEPRFLSALTTNLPGALVRIVDSYRQLPITKDKYGLVLLDAPIRRHGSHYEHFDLLPTVLNVLDDDAILIVNIMPEWKPARMDQEHRRKRREFYGVEDASRIPIDRMVAPYESCLRQNGFHLRWWFVKDRLFLFGLRRRYMDFRLCYLVMAVDRVGQASAMPAGRAS
jgi:hypothetical protein